MSSRQHHRQRLWRSLWTDLCAGLIFLFFAVLVWQWVQERQNLSWKLIVLSILFGLLYWGVPMFLFIKVDRMLGI